jgi:predicted secreted protein
MNKFKLFLVISMVMAIISVPEMSISAPSLLVSGDEAGILLFANLPAGRMNEMELLHPLIYGWFMEDYNPSTGYTWRFTPDNSGVYRIFKRVILHGSTGMVGVPGKIIWQFQATQKGTGKAIFELLPPGKKVPEKTDVVIITVK